MGRPSGAALLQVAPWTPTDPPPCPVFQRPPWTEGSIRDTGPRDSRTALPRIDNIQPFCSFLLVVFIDPCAEGADGYQRAAAREFAPIFHEYLGLGRYWPYCWIYANAANAYDFGRGSVMVCQPLGGLTSKRLLSRPVFIRTHLKSTVTTFPSFFWYRTIETGRPSLRSMWKCISR